MEGTMASLKGSFSPAFSFVLPRLSSAAAAPTSLNQEVLIKGSRRSCKVSTQTVHKLSILATSDTSTIAVAPIDKPEASPKKNIDYQVVKITTNTSSLRGCCFDRLKFEVEYGLRRGTTDNSYMIKATETALIDVPDENFKELFLDALQNSLESTVLNHVVLGHISPKRLKCLIGLLELLDSKGLHVQVHCSNPAAQLLSTSLPENLKEKTCKLRTIRSGDHLNLGEGHNLEFILTPTPRWPDGMCTYDPATQLLFTHKLFSAHVCSNNQFDLGGWDSYGEDWRYFYDCMLSPVPRQAGAALEKLPIVSQFAKPSYAGKTGIDIIKADVRFILSTVFSALNLPINKAAGLAKDQRSEGLLVTSALCPIHGPVVRSTITELVREYRVWTEEKLKRAKEATIAVIYASAYGNTAALAQAISRGISKAGVGVESLNAELSSSADVADLVNRCCGFVVGSPTLGGHMPTPVQNALGVILRDTNARSKPCGVFGSFGWSGEAVDEIEKRLKDAGFSFAFPTIRCKFKPTESMLQVCEESGTDLAQFVQRAKVKERGKASPQFSTASDVEQAVGRVIGSLCVVSAKEGDAESAMLASWVSQASFVPPGLTIAVAKDRAVESLLLPGGKFVLNVLGQGKTGPIMKQLLKPFKPGEARFEGLNVKEASNGGQILLDAIAWLECTVKSRMETGDHWVLYALVDNGELQDEKTLSALHYRKTGARY
ncbi:hypothetical protein GOP47_0028496 [Adiantum capillus-veneris]|nr:hypothetical protein GOP47_0028496 [Adiantum capillus-veneris]